jgi:CHAT domain-containing protein
MKASLDIEKRLSIVVASDVPGFRKIDGVETESRLIKEIPKDRFQTSVKNASLGLNQASAQAVLHEIEDCDIVHFACHGVADYEDPSQSFLALRKDDESGHPELDKLLVKDIFDAQLRRPLLAYLSACSTAENISSIVDEHIHLTSAFQVAGFSHVIGSLYPTTDSVCTKVASIFYEKLFEGLKNELDQSKVIAASLHYAIDRIRSKNPGMVLEWAPYIHSGA